MQRSLGIALVVLFGLGPSVGRAQDQGHRIAVIPYVAVEPGGTRYDRRVAHEPSASEYDVRLSLEDAALRGVRVEFQLLGDWYIVGDVAAGEGRGTNAICPLFLAGCSFGAYDIEVRRIGVGITRRLLSLPNRIATLYGSVRGDIVAIDYARYDRLELNERGVSLGVDLEVPLGWLVTDRLAVRIGAAGGWDRVDTRTLERTIDEPWHGGTGSVRAEPAWTANHRISAGLALRL